MAEAEYEEKKAFYSSGLVEPSDFALQCNDFLDKMKQSSAFELVKNIKKFINAFIHQQHPQPIEERVDEIRQFLDDTSLVIERHPLWKTAPMEEIEIAAEALERYTMHKVHKSVYSPSREDDARRDREFVQQLEQLSFITPALLDIPLSGPTCEAGWEVAASQLRKMETCKSPRDKVTCVMNLFTALCKLLVEVQSGNAAGADDLMPNVIYTILRAKPAHWYSDVRYIQRFRHPGRLSSEAGYYMTQMMGAVAFLEKVEGHHLDMSESDFRKAKRGEYVPIPKIPKRKARKVKPSLDAVEGKTSTGEEESSVEVLAAETSDDGDTSASQGQVTTTTGDSLASESVSSLHSNTSTSSRTSNTSATDGRRSKPPTPTISTSSSPGTQSRHASVSSSSSLAAAGDASAALAAVSEMSATSRNPASVPNGHGGSANGCDLSESAGSAKVSPAPSTSTLSVPSRRVSAIIDSDNPANSILSPLASVSVSPVPEAGIIERFLDCKFKELTIGDMTDLLKNYRILVHKYCTLRAQLATNAATSAHAQLQARSSLDGTTPVASAGETTPTSRQPARPHSQTSFPESSRSLTSQGSKEDSVFVSNPSASG